MTNDARRRAEEFIDELAKAQAKHAPMHGPHEGYAVILEELDELWDEVKAQHQDRDRMRKEALQVAAMALRFIVDVCGRSGGRPMPYVARLSGSENRAMTDEARRLHEHYWLYPHNQIEGHRQNETVVVRYCACGMKQMAVATNWRPATGHFKLEEHYESD